MRTFTMTACGGEVALMKCLLGSNSSRERRANVRQPRRQSASTWGSAGDDKPAGGVERTTAPNIKSNLHQLVRVVVLNHV